MKSTVNMIPHLEEIKKIRQYEQDVLNETNIPVVDISHWNPGKEYKDIILSQYNATTPLDILDYHYSYEYNCNLRLKTLQLLIEKAANNLDCVFIHNATSAICCVADYLKKQRYKKLCILEPSYFSTYACLKSFSLNVYKEEINLDNHGNIELPYDAIIKKGYDVVWLTSPIFSTGIYYSKNQIENINALLQRGILLVIDESAASPNYTLTHNLYPYENIVSIFSPHKYLALNSTKFAAIISKQSICKYFEDWIDVFAGALPISACIAIEHFLSPNFNACLELHDKYIKSNLAYIKVSQSAGL